jgi:hypothetical protein
MKLLISFMTAVSLGLTCTVLGADNYSALAAKGYRWVTVNGPYACKTEEDAERIAAHHTDAIELQVVENIECYYLIPGTIVQVIKEDPVRSMSEMRLGSITRSLWTYSRFLSKHPVKDTYGVIKNAAKLWSNSDCGHGNFASAPFRKFDCSDLAERKSVSRKSHAVIRSPGIISASYST